MNAHCSSFRIYYEDTDAGGVVYYANYLRFAERARTEWLRELGFSQSHLAKDEGIFIMVRHCAVDYLASARLDDVIEIETLLKERGKVRMTIRQVIRRADKQLALVEVELACVGGNGKPALWPQALSEKWASLEAGNGLIS